MTTYDRPQKAELHVHLENGETWKATDEDLVKFGLVENFEAYMRFRRALWKVLTDGGVLDGDLTEAHLNPVRHLAETAIVFPDLLDHPDHEGWQSVVHLERFLAEHVERVP